MRHRTHHTSSPKHHETSGKARLFLIAKVASLVGALVVVLYALSDSNVFVFRYDATEAEVTGGGTKDVDTTIAPVPQLDKKDYDARMLALANYPSLPPIATSTAITTTKTKTTATSTPRRWPANAPYPNAGAILPFKRVVAYYGNFLSTQMGVLGQYPADEVIARLKAAAASWEAADPTTPVMPAIDYIAISAQGSPGKAGKYRLRMPDSEIDHALDLAAQVHGIVFLDLQVGLSDVQTEIPLLEHYLAMPQVHLALDPEFSMKTGIPPGKVIGTMDASDINFAANYLAALVRKYNLPPKILVVHRFTEDMLTGYRMITPLPEVQIVIDMDGWGFPAKKINTYKAVVASEPVQFTGFKLFYKNDLLPPSTALLTPAQILSLQPRPIYIQYQ